MKKVKLKKILLIFFWMALASIAGWAGPGYAGGLFSFTDIEKPNPQFNRTDNVITAKLIPRAKSNSVEISFAVVEGGRLGEVKGIDFFSIDRPEVDVKNFKSAAFEIMVDNVPKGEEANISVSSDFFSSSTRFFVFNAKLDTPWIKDKSVNLSKGQRIRELRVAVKDGGPLDSDGDQDGHITLIGGPRDSFWGYALGTLFIRFFGIFLVLTVLMAGMLISGVFFSRSDRRRRQGIAPKQDQVQPATDHPSISARSFDNGQNDMAPTEEEVAAIGAALDLYFRNLRYAATKSNIPQQSADAWSEEGRKRIMYDRLRLYNRGR